MPIGEVTVERLIEMLQKVEDKTQPMEIAIRQYNKSHPVAYTKIHNDNWLQQVHGKVRLTTNLPENMRTSVRKTV
jgi:hypothetical protein